MVKKLKIILIFLIICLIGVGVFCFLNIQKKESAQTKTTPNLKLLTSHSSPQAGENWVVSFETIGIGDLTITPKDSETVGDLDFISLTCNGEERTLQILENDAIFYTNWQCAGKGELTHLVNIARKHTLKFSFGNLSAFAYNNPDSVTDTFSDTSKIAATSSVVVIGGQVKLVKTNGTACSSGSECGSGYCVDSVCCDTACGGTCQACVFSKTGSATGTCANITSNTDPDSECAGACKVCKSGSCDNATADTDTEGSCTGNCDECDGAGACRGDNTYCANTGSSCYCLGSGTSYSCQACLNTTSSCNCSGYACQSCSDPGLCKYPTCSSYTCGSANETIDYQETGCNGCNWCSGSGSCKTCYWEYSDTQTVTLWETFPQGCKPSRINSGNWSYSSEGEACSASLLRYRSTGYDTAYRYYCRCP